MAEITREQLILALIAAGPNPRLAGVDLTALDLKRLSLEGANVRGANLQGANLQEAILRATNMTGVDFIRLRIPIAWWATLDDVAYEYFFSTHSYTRQ